MPSRRCPRPSKNNVWALEVATALKWGDPCKSIQHSPSPLLEVPSSPPAGIIATANSSLSNLKSDPRKAPPTPPRTPPLQPKGPLSATESPPGSHDRNYQSKIVPFIDKKLVGPRESYVLEGGNSCKTNQHPPAPLAEIPSSPPAEIITVATSFPSKLMSDPRKDHPTSLRTPTLQ